MHEWVICSPQGVWGFGGCLIFFCLLNEGLLQLCNGGAGSGSDSCWLQALFGDMPSFSTEQAKAASHVALTLLWGQLAVLSQFPSQFRARFWILWGLTLGHGLGVSSTFQVTLRVNLTHQVSLAHNFSLPLPVAVIDGLYELTEIQQHDGPVMVHHLILMQWASPL